MKAFIELEDFFACVKLPDGIHFKEWDGKKVKDVSALETGNGNIYIKTEMVGLESEDGKLATFKFDSLCDDSLGITLSSLELSQAIDKAISELECA